MIKAIIFDLWSTIAHRNSISKKLAEIFKIDRDLHTYEKAVQLRAWENMDELAESYLKARKLEVNKKNIDIVKSVFDEGEHTIEWIKGMEELLKELKQKYKLGLLSNTSKFVSDATNAALNHEEIFDEIVYSWQIRIKKPSKESFEAICKKLDVKFEETIFVDDTEENIVAAKKLGINAIQFKEADRLKKDIKKYLEEKQNE